MKSFSWRASKLALAAALVLAFVATQPSLASSLFGIYAIVDRVVFEPSESAPERIKICGVFVVPVPMLTSRHGTPQRGFLYYRIAPGREETTRKEWAYLKTVAGTRPLRLHDTGCQTRPTQTGILIARWRSESARVVSLPHRTCTR